MNMVERLAAFWKQVMDDKRLEARGEKRFNWSSHPRFKPKGFRAKRRKIRKAQRMARRANRP